MSSSRRVEGAVDASPQSHAMAGRTSVSRTSLGDEKTKTERDLSVIVHAEMLIDHWPKVCLGMLTLIDAGELADDEDTFSIVDRTRL